MNEVLIRKAKKGDKDAFCRLMDENVQSMYKIAAAYLKNDEDVADAIQDTILSCYENLKSLKQNRYFKTWMIRILINKCKDMIQKKKLVTYTDQMPETPFHEEKYAAMGAENFGDASRAAVEDMIADIRGALENSK